MRTASFSIDLPIPPTVTSVISGQPIPSGISICNQQQAIPPGGFTGADFFKVLTNYNQVENVCGAHFNFSGNATYETFNHGYFLFILERLSPVQPLQFCPYGLNSILVECVLEGNTYGGTFSQGGETYTITNSIFPGNPLNPDDLKNLT